MADIIQTRVPEDSGETLITDIEITFPDGEKETFSVSHFMPKSKEEVLQNIAQFELSENVKRDARKTNENIAQELQKNIV